MTTTETQPQSSTPLFLNGDLRPANPIRRLRYLLYHHYRNKRENAVPFEREIPWPTKRIDFAPAIDKVTFEATPSRVLCNAFWSLVDWESLRRELGELVFHDIGCGSGWYSELIRGFTDCPLTYRGFDVVENRKWEELRDGSTEFAVYDGHSFASTFKGEPTLFISQSALEHIPEDLGYFRAVSDYCRERDRVAQIHLVPGATGLRQWGLHGWRQYNRDMLRRIRETLTDGMEMSVYCLGGPEIVDLHVKWFGRKRRRRAIQRDPAERDIYRAEWLHAMETSTPVGVDRASFLAIIIEKGFTPPLWPRLLRTSSGDVRAI